MDLQDEGRVHLRVMGCLCNCDPKAPPKGSGCQCTGCGARCKACIGFGYQAPPARPFHLIINSVQTQIIRRVELQGHPPGFIRLRPEEVRLVLDKMAAETLDHWAHDYVDVGPPLRIYDVRIIPDLRRVAPFRETE